MKSLIFSIVLVLAFSVLAVAQDKNTGGVRGTVRMRNGNSISNVLVQAQQNEKDIASTKTDRKGEFTLNGLKTGIYNFVFTKDGLSQGVLPRIEVKAGETVTLKRLVMAVDEGTLAILRGSVFDPNGRSIRGAKVEVLKISGDSTKKISEDYSSESGEFVFRLPASAGRYRISVNIKGAEPASKEVDINGAQIYRVAISLKPKA